jgi:5-methylcytosine-specific restriction endonuclease McrA
MSLILISIIFMRKNLADRRLKAHIVRLTYPQNNKRGVRRWLAHFCTHCVDKIVSKAMDALSSL